MRFSTALLALVAGVSARSHVTTGETPAGCNALSDDHNFPSLETLKQTIPMIQPKEGDNRPDYHVTAMNFADVQAAVKAAAKYNLRLSVLNSGHDYLGRNDAPSGLSIDVSKLRKIKVFAEFIPSTSTDTALDKDEANVVVPQNGKQAAVTFGAGLSTQEINDALAKSKLFTVGAAHGEVAVAGGWGQVGGHSPLSATYGLGVDQALEYKVVTADGNLVIANAQTNPDLFWALRGGGGSTFGIVVEATIKAHPSPKVAMAGWAYSAKDAADPGDAYWDAAAQLHRELPALSKAGFQGYYYIYPSRTVGFFLTTGDDATDEKVKSIVAPALDRIANFQGISREEITYSNYDNFKAFFDDEWGPLGSDEDVHDANGKKDSGRQRLGFRFRRDMPMDGMNGEQAEPNGRSQLDGRLLGERHLSNPKLAQLLKAALPKISHGELRGNFVAGPGVHDPADGANATSANPAWRTTLTNLVATGAHGDWNADSLRELAPDSGAYPNEASWSQPDWKRAFWGANYDRLLDIKKKMDPDHLFWCTPCVGADLLKVVDGRVCKTDATGAAADSAPPASDNPNINDDMEGNEGKSIKKWKPKGY